MWFKAIITILALAALAAGAFCWFLGDYASPPSSRTQIPATLAQPAAPLPKMEGIYLNCVLINEPCFKAEMTTSGAQLIPFYYRYGWRMEPRGKTLAFFEIVSESEPGAVFYPDPRTGRRRAWAKRFEVVPSTETPGDWDLVAFQYAKEGSNACEPIKVPIRSALHRLDDPRIIDYFKNVEYWGMLYLEKQTGRPTYPSGFSKPKPEAESKALLKQAAAIAADHPTDLHARLIYLYALLRAGDLQTLERELARWSPQFERPGVNTAGFHLLVNAVQARRLSAAGRNAADLVTSLTSLRADLATRVRLAPEIFKFDSFVWDATIPNQYATPKRPGDYAMPYYLDLQTQVKTCNVLSDFMLLWGQRTPALQLPAANYRLGQLLNQNDILLTRLIGIALRSLASSQLGLYALNACETPGELNQCWQVLEQLNRTEGNMPPARELFRNELWQNNRFACYPEDQWPQVEEISYDFQEALTRHGVADARFQLVRMAAATRGKQLMLGMLPRDASDLGPLFTTGAPLDPFTSAPLHLRPSPMGVTCYSFGPDRADDFGAITYDPSNGTTSRGDIILEVPARRQYPFPRNGVHARTPRELLTQFPNGLPPDPFADTRGRPLSISNTSPMYIYSFGPDTDEHDSSVTHPEVAYDPTNGTSSSGDLFMQVPWR